MVIQHPLPFHNNGIAVLARHLLEQHADSLPDLSHVVVCLPEPLEQKQLRRALLQHSDRDALILPWTGTFRQWVCHLIPPPATVLNNHGREMMMAQVLRDNPAAFGHGNNPWTLADELLKLFDALELADKTPEALQALQQAGGGLFATEAAKIRLLWEARNLQYEQDGVCDHQTWYSHALQQLPSLSSQPDTSLYLIRHQALKPLEQRALTDSGWLKTRVFEYHPSASADAPPVSYLIKQVFDEPDKGLKQRAHALAESHDAQCFTRLKFLAADSREQEAACVDLIVRQWVIEGKARIAVVTENRLLARRISALLGRAGLKVFDSAGWPLSTTSAAAAVEHWLGCVESDFHRVYMMDFLQSVFFRFSHPETDATSLFDRHIVWRCDTDSGLENYQNVAKSLKLPTEEREAILEILDRLRTGARQLAPLQAGEHAASTFLEQLLQALRAVGMITQLEQDPAGQRVLQEIEDLRQTAERFPVDLSWTEFRLWFGRALETHNFRPALNDDGIAILNLEQASHAQFDAVVVASADEKTLPGNFKTPGLFNYTVHQELGLETPAELTANRFSRFRRLLETAGAVVVSYSQQSKQGVQLPSPWLNLIDHLYQASFDHSLYCDSIKRAVGHPRSQPDSRYPLALPATSQRSRVRLPSQRVPEYLSAGTHQKLIDCPYQFFGQAALGILPREPTLKQISNRDFGILVHDCLFEFHKEVEHIRDLSSSIAALTRISEQKFQSAIDRHFINSGWWMAWQSLIPEYCRWEHETRNSWRVERLEWQASVDISAQTRLKGIIDRLDRDDSNTRLIDYKTGQVPSQKNIASGEDVQLLSYALMVGSVTESLYLQLKNKQIRAIHAPADGDLIEAAGQRLKDMLDAIRRGQYLTAWGDDDACKRCQFPGICRRGSWSADSVQGAETTQ